MSWYEKTSTFRDLAGKTVFTSVFVGLFVSSLMELINYLTTLNHVFEIEYFFGNAMFIMTLVFFTIILGLIMCRVWNQ